MAFWIGIGATFSLVSFIYFFDTRPSAIWTPRLAVIGITYLSILLFYLATNYIIQDVTYVTDQKIYREVLWTWYLLHVALHSLWLILFVWISIKQIKKQVYLNKIRLKRILYAMFLFIFFALFFQLFLPLFGIWILEKEIIFLYTLFVVYTFFTVKRYYFSSLGYGVWKVAIAIVAAMLSIVVLNFIKWMYLHIQGGVINNYWMLQDSYSIIDTIAWILLFSWIYGIFTKIFLCDDQINLLKNKMQGLQESISQTTNIADLNARLWRDIKAIFKTKFSEVRVFPKDKTEIQKYFENKLTDKIFINDIVFIEEKKSKFNKERILQEIPRDAFLILPIFNRSGNHVIGIFIVWVKSFGDFYTTDEIDALRNFVSFLELHFKYIKTYAQIHDLSVNLDKKVDEKTMEYNNLINKQKEFISMLSHEIKSPIANAIFQADSMLDDIEGGALSGGILKSELTLLNNQLIKAGELISKLFSVQYFDTNNVVLFREKVQISYLLETEFEIYSRMHENISFINRIDPDMGFIEIDQIQFQQVISNLLNNAVKFTGKDDSIICINAYKKDGFLHTVIGDNGRWFQWIDTARLFEKYSTGTSDSVGLGMWLYLCKKIIDMHYWKIFASVSNELGGAEFNIQIPVH